MIGKIVLSALLAATALSLPAVNELPPRKIVVGKTNVMTISPETAEIVIAKNAYKTTRFALKELNTLLGEAFGKPLNVVNKPTAGKVSIILGDNEYSRAAGLDVSKLVRDGYYIKTVGNKIFIVGEDDPKESPEAMLKSGGAWSHFYHRGTLHGVYDFLERAAGMRFYFAGSLGTVVPKTAKLEIPAYDIEERPDFSSRKVSNFWDGTWYEGEKRDAVINPAKNLNSYRLRISTRFELCSHGLSRMAYLERFGKSHPEYFALMPNGSRSNNPAEQHPGQLCMTSGIREEIYQDAKAVLTGDISKRPELKIAPQWRFRRYCMGYFDLMPQDSFRPCQCEKCKATYGTGKYYANDLIWKFTAEIGSRLKKEGIKGDIQQMAYRPYRAIPPFEIPDNIRVTVAERGPWAEAFPEAQKLDDAEIIAWSKKLNRKVLLWNYANRGGATRIKGVPSITPRAIGKYYQRISAYADGAFMESESERFMYNHLNYYIFLKVAWNNQSDYNAMVDEYYQKMFGAAAPIMKKIMDNTEKIWLEKIGGRTVDTDLGPVGVPPSNHEIWTKIYTPEVIASILKDLDKAEQITSGIERERVKLMRREVYGPLAEAAKDHIEHTSAVRGLRYNAGTDETVAPIKMHVFQGKNKKTVATEVRVWFADNAVNVRFDCEEPFMDKVLTVKREFDDADIWRDNSVELFLNPDGKRKEYCHMMINSIGCVTDRWAVSLGTTARGDNKYNTKAKVSATRTAKGYRIDVSIPESSLPGLDKKNMVANFTRNRILSDARDIETLYTWSHYLRNSFHDVENFGTITSGEESLLFNGDFSVKPLRSNRHWGKWEGSKWLEGWIGVDAVGSKLDDKVFVSAPYSMKLISTNPKKGAETRYWTIKKLKPNTKYRISFMVKTENIRGKGGACLNLVDTANRWFPDHNMLRGTSDWSFQSFDYTTAPGTNQGKIPCTLGVRILNATGTAWFDDVKIVELGQ